MYYYFQRFTRLPFRACAVSLERESAFKAAGVLQALPSTRLHSNDPKAIINLHACENSSDSHYEYSFYGRWSLPFDQAHVWDHGYVRHAAETALHLKALQYSAIDLDA
jgi:hypothetical protein